MILRVDVGGRKKAETHFRSELEGMSRCEVGVRLEHALQGGPQGPVPGTNRVRQASPEWSSPQRAARLACHWCVLRSLEDPCASVKVALLS
jgi:hypothetical protein